MSLRPRMEEELMAINEKITLMAQRIQRDILRAVDSLKERDAMLARQIIDEGDVVDDMEDEINADCFNFGHPGTRCHGPAVLCFRYEDD